MTLADDPTSTRTRAQFYAATREFLDAARADRRRLGLLEGQPIAAHVQIPRPSPDTSENPYSPTEFAGLGCSCRHNAPESLLGRLFPNR